MIKISVHIKDPKAVVKSKLILLCTLPSGRIKIYLPHSVNPEQWDAKEQRFKKSFPHFKEANLSLSQIKSAVEKYYLTQMSLGIPTTGLDIKNIIASFSGIEKETEINPEKNLSFCTVYKVFLETYTGSRTKSTVAKHRRNLELLQSFYTYPRKAPLKRKKPKEGEESIPLSGNFKPIPFEAVTVEFIDKWVNYLLKYAEFTNNSVVKAVKFLNTFLNWASAREFNTQLKYKDYKPSGLSRETDVIALTEKELLKIYYLDLLKSPALARVRDLFCFSAFTGQRFSDVIGLHPEHIKNKTWHLRVQKTTEINRVPLNEFALEILNRYPGQKLPAISNQKTNDYLKIIGELAEINEPISLFRYRGPERIERSEPKYNFIGTHTARRTFATVMLEKGMRPEVVMKVGGWKDYRSFKKYIRLTDTVTASEMNAIKWAKP